MEGQGFLGEHAEDLGECGGLDGAHEGGAVLGADELAHPAEAPADGGVEVVLDAVVGPAWREAYLPGMCSAMRVHLLPKRLCSCISRSSSPFDHTFLEMPGTK